MRSRVKPKPLSRYIFAAVFALCKPFLFQRVIDKIDIAKGDPYEALSKYDPHPSWVCNVT
jgi:hypothetical protein